VVLSSLIKKTREEMGQQSALKQQDLTSKLITKCGAVTAFIWVGNTFNMAAAATQRMRTVSFPSEVCGDSIFYVV